LLGKHLMPVPSTGSLFFNDLWNEANSIQWWSSAPHSVY
jgi:hypothetical protein